MHTPSDIPEAVTDAGPLGSYPIELPFPDIRPDAVIAPAASRCHGRSFWGAAELNG
jgi:hypothetical protein